VGDGRLVPRTIFNIALVDIVARFGRFIQRIVSISPLDAFRVLQKLLVFESLHDHDNDFEGEQNAQSDSQYSANDRNYHNPKRDRLGTR